LEATGKQDTGVRRLGSGDKAKRRKNNGAGSEDAVQTVETHESKSEEQLAPVEPEEQSVPAGLRNHRQTGNMPITTSNNNSARCKHC